MTGTTTKRGRRVVLTGPLAALQTFCDRKEYHVTGPEDTQITESDTDDEIPIWALRDKINAYIDSLPPD
jgi:hypothetical protein